MRSRLHVATLLALSVGLSLCLAGCGGHVAAPSEQVVKTVEVPVPASCPERSIYLKLKAGRPRPLRDQPMPTTDDVRVARTTAQLGKFEAPGAWADKVEAALDRCQIEGLAPAP